MKYLGWILAAVFTLNLAWTLLNRTGPQHARPRASVNQADIPLSHGLRLNSFYATPAEVVEGEKAIVCYGVENAKSVTLDPPVEEVRPVFSRCFDIHPTATATYRFTATGDKGEKVTAQFTLPVKPAPPFIFMFTTSEKKIRRGDRFTICYGVRYAEKVKLDPIGWNLPPVPKNCVMLWPSTSMKLTMTATGTAGMTDKATASVEVGQRL